MRNTTKDQLTRKSTHNGIVYAMMSGLPGRKHNTSVKINLVKKTGAGRSGIDKTGWTRETVSISRKFSDKHNAETYVTIRARNAGFDTLICVNEEGIPYRVKTL